MAELKVGDVMRWDKAWEQELSDPLWCLVIGDDDDGVWTDVNLLGGSEMRDRFPIGDTGDFDWPPTDRMERYAHGCIVPPDDWPDEVCAAVAMYKLGVLTKGEE
jgi:hypothetical protein